MAQRKLTDYVAVRLLEPKENIQHLDLPGILSNLASSLCINRTHRVITKVLLSNSNLFKPSSGLPAGARTLCSHKGDSFADGRSSYENVD